MRCVLSTVFLLIFPWFAAAQTKVADDNLPIPAKAQAILDAFGKPLHPILGGVAPSGGIGVGIGYDTPRDRDWFHNASGIVTVSGYWAVGAETGYQTHESRIGLFGSVRDMSGLNFYGLGPTSDVLNESIFRLRESNIGARGWLRPKSNFRIGGSAELYSPDAGPGSRRRRSIETVFQPGDIPGFTAEPLFTRYRGFAELTYPRLADPSAPRGRYQSHEGTYQIAYEIVRDRDGGTYNFHRIEGEVKEQIAGFRRGQRLTLHGLVAVTNTSGSVPYYLQYTLGGGGLSAFRPNLLGTDGTTATLRGYSNYRFRDRDLLLAQAEYRIPLRGPVDATVFYDVGQVAPRLADFGDDLKQDTGFSLSYMRKGVALLRLDVGYGGGEGVHFFWGFGGLGF